MISPPPLFHCLDAQVLTGFSRPLFRGICRGQSIGNTGKFRHSIKNTPLAGTCGAGIAQTLRNLRHLTLTPKPRVLGSSPSTPGCEIPRKPFKHWLPGDFPCAQILCLSAMILPFFARFCLVFHRRSIKNAPRVLAKGGKGVVGVRIGETCGERWSEVEGGSQLVKTGRECFGFAKMEIDRKTACY